MDIVIINDTDEEDNADRTNNYYPYYYYPYYFIRCLFQGCFYSYKKPKIL